MPNASGDAARGFSGIRAAQQHPEALAARASVVVWQCFVACHPVLCVPDFAASMAHLAVYWVVERLVC